MTKVKMFAFVGMFFSITAHAQTTSLDFNSLPTAQGWTYSAVQGTYGNFSPSPVPESSVFSVNNGVITQNTIGQGYFGATYSRQNVVDFNVPYTINVTARFIGNERGTDAYSLEFGVHSATFATGFDIGNGYISDSNGSHVLAYLDTSIFHNYTFDGNPDGSYNMFVDGVGVASYQGVNINNQNPIIYFGDATPDGSNATGQISNYTVSQVSSVPEPESLFLILLGFPLLLSFNCGSRTTALSLPDILN